MITLFKKRNFSDYLNDSFDFFKKGGKHYFKNYFTVMGVFLLIISVCIYFICKIYFEFIFSQIRGNTNVPDYSYLTNFIDGNFGLLILGGILFTVGTLFLTLINFSFPIIYLEEYEKNGGPNFSSKELFSNLKSKFGKLILFFILSLFLITPIVLILSFILVLLSFIIIGIPLFIIAIPTIFSILSLTLYNYLNSNDGYFGSLGKAFQYIFKQYWSTIGSTMIIYIIIQIAITVFSMIPYIIATTLLVTTLEIGPSNTETFSILGITMTILFVIVTLCHYIFNNLLMINQGLIYYSRREHIENKSSFTEIENIGSHFE